MQYACPDCGTIGPTKRCPTHAIRPGRPRGRAYQAERQAIAQRDGWQCAICGDPIDPALRRPHPDALAVDHDTARARGGADTADNLRATHARCNARKGAH